MGVALLASRRDVLLLIAPLLALGVARPVATVAATAGTVGAMPAGARGLASALATQSRQLGAELAVAVLGLVVTSTEHAERTTLLHSVDARFDAAARAARDALVADRGDALLAGLPPAQRSAALDAAADAYVHGFRIAMLVVAAVALVAAAVAARLIRGPRARDGRVH